MDRKIKVECEGEILLEKTAPELTEEKKLEILRQFGEIIEERWLIDDANDRIF